VAEDVVAAAVEFEVVGHGGHSASGWFCCQRAVS
jgi:hypothetical protein